MQMINNFEKFWLSDLWIAPFIVFTCNDSTNVILNWHDNRFGMFEWVTTKDFLSLMLIWLDWLSKT